MLLDLLKKVIPWYDEGDAQERDNNTKTAIAHADVAIDYARVVISSYQAATKIITRSKRSI